MKEKPRACPECGHEFQGNGWDGIDAHWCSKHIHIMNYEEAWPLIAAGEYKPAGTKCATNCEKLEQEEPVPILCKLWQEDDLWNGIALDLPVAVFGKTFEEAKRHLFEALDAHFETLREIGSYDEA